MSNRTLLITVAILVVAFAAVVFGSFMLQKSSPEENGSGSQPSNIKFSGDQTPLEDKNSCKRDFDSDKLSKNGNLNIAGRQVQIQVKDFGPVTLEFYDKDAPKAVENFLRLTDSGYFNCLTFHRVAKGFVIQGGDPNGNGTGGQSAFGQPFEDELNPSAQSYKAGYVKGVLAMANSGPNTNGSQFFIMLADNNLPHNYTIFGKVVSGLDVVDKIGAVAINPVMGPSDGSPKQPVVMESVKIIK